MMSDQILSAKCRRRIRRYTAVVY